MDIIASRSGFRQRCPGCQHSRGSGGRCIFSEVIDLKGIKIYKQETDAVNSNGVDTKGKDVDNVSYIIHNTRGTAIHSKDLRSPIDEANISCPRCKTNLQHAQKLFTRIPSIGRNVMISICHHCEIQDSLIKTCKKCARVIREFLDSREVDYEIKEKEILPWLTTMQKALQEEFVKSAATTSRSSWVSSGKSKDLSQKLLVNQGHAFDLASVLRDGHVKLSCTPCESRSMVPMIDFEETTNTDFEFLKYKTLKNKSDFSEFAKQHKVSIQEPKVDCNKQGKLQSIYHSEESLVSIGLARDLADQLTASTATKLRLRSSLKKHDKLRFISQAKEYYSDEYLNRTESKTAFQYIFPRIKQKNVPQTNITSSELIKQTLEKTFQDKKLQQAKISAKKPKQLAGEEKNYRLKSIDISSFRANGSPENWDVSKFKRRDKKIKQEVNGNLERDDESGISYKLAMTGEAEGSVGQKKPRQIEEKKDELNKSGNFEQPDFKADGRRKGNVMGIMNKNQISGKSEKGIYDVENTKMEKETTRKVENGRKQDRGKNREKYYSNIAIRDMEDGASTHNIKDKDGKSRQEERDRGDKKSTVAKRENFETGNIEGKERKTDKIYREYNAAKVGKEEKSEKPGRSKKEIQNNKIEKRTHSDQERNHDEVSKIEKWDTLNKTVKDDRKEQQNKEETTKKPEKDAKEKSKTQKGETAVKAEKLEGPATYDNDGKKRKGEKERTMNKLDKVYNEDKREYALNKDGKSGKANKGKFQTQDNQTSESIGIGDTDENNKKIIKGVKGYSSKEAPKGKQEKISYKIESSKPQLKGRKKQSDESKLMVSEDQNTRPLTKSEIENEKLVQKEDVKRKQEYEKRTREMEKNIKENREFDDPGAFITIGKKPVEKENLASKKRDNSSQKKTTARDNEKPELRRKLELERKLKEYDQNKGVPLLRVVTEKDNKNEETDDIIILTKSQEELVAKRKMEDLILMRQLEERRKAKANQIVLPFTTPKTKLAKKSFNIQIIEVKQEEELESEDEFEEHPDDSNRNRYKAPEIIIDANIYAYTKELEDELVKQGKPLNPMLFNVKAEDIKNDEVLLPNLVAIEKMNLYRMTPAQPQFDWFERNKSKGTMYYDCGERLAEFENEKTARWYYRNGRAALEYYEAEEVNAQRRIVVYSNGEPDDRGRIYPVTILATFDYIGNGIVFDHTGKIRLKYNQTEGVMLDRTLGPITQWKWHSLNDPPVLQQVMIDNELPVKDETITNLYSPDRNREQPDNERMLVIEYDNYIKEKNKKVTRKFKPFQIKMKALKINENFSLKVLDQANVYLYFREGTTSLKLNLGMKLNNKEIVDSDTVEVGFVGNPMEKLPAKSASLARMQLSLTRTQRIERERNEYELKIRSILPASSTDRMHSAVSHNLQATFPQSNSARTSRTGTSLDCIKPCACTVFYAN